MFVTGGKVTKQAGNTIKKKLSGKKQKQWKRRAYNRATIQYTNDKEKNYEISCVTRLQDCRDRTPCDLRTDPENLRTDHVAAFFSLQVHTYFTHFPSIPHNFSF